MEPPQKLFDLQNFIQKSTSMLKFTKQSCQQKQKEGPSPTVKPGFLINQFEVSPPEQGIPIQEVYAEMKTKILPGILNWQSTKFFGYFPAVVSDAAVLADIFSLTFNTPAFNYAVSPTHTELENLVVDWSAKALGLPQVFHRKNAGGGVISSSASNSAFLAVHAAKISKLESQKIQLNDPRSLKLVGYVSDTAHIAGLRGLMLKDIYYRRLIPTYFCQEAKNYLVDLQKLKQIIDQDVKDGLIPFFYNASIGTTETGTVDQIFEISQICKQYGIWLNVDAAYLGSTWICPEYRQSQKGIENANSVILNFSKLGFIGVGGSLFYVSNKEQFSRTMKLNNQFGLYRTSAGTEDNNIIDYKDWKVDLAKHPIAFRFYLLYRLYGVKAIQQAYRWRQKLAIIIQNNIKESEIFELFSKRSYALVCFRLKGQNSVLTEKLASRISNLDEGFLTGGNVKGSYVIRMSVANPNTTVQEIDNWWKKISSIAQELLDNKQQNSQ